VVLYISKTDLDQTISASKTGVDLDSTDGFAWTVLGEAYKVKGDTESAITALKRAVEENPDYFFAWCGLGQAYRMKGEVDASLMALKTSIEKCPDYIPALHELCSLYEQLRNWDGVIEIRKIMNEKFASDLGKSYIAKGDLIKAIDVFEKGIEKFPTNNEPFIEIGFVHMAMGKYDRAIKILQTAIEIETLSPPSSIWQHPSEAFVADNDLEGALRTLHMAIEKFPSLHYFWIRFCEVCNMKGEYDMAIAVLKRWMENDTAISLHWGLLGQTFMAKKDFKEAIKLFQEAIDKFPEEVQFWGALGKVYYITQDYDEAVTILTKAVGKNPTRYTLVTTCRRIYGQGRL
jgi:tetratricopeptide (TPR) repeat protein